MRFKLKEFLSERDQIKSIVRWLCISGVRYKDKNG